MEVAGAVGEFNRNENEVNKKIGVAWTPEWRSALRHWIAVLAVPLGLSPGCHSTGRPIGQCTIGPASSRFGEGLAGRVVLVPSRTSDSCGGPGAVHADMVARCTVFPPTHWCGWLPG